MQCPTLNPDDVRRIALAAGLSAFLHAMTNENLLDKDRVQFGARVQSDMEQWLSSGFTLENIMFSNGVNIDVMMKAWEVSDSVELLK